MGYMQITNGQEPARYDRGFRHADWNVSHGPGAAAG